MKKISTANIKLMLFGKPIDLDLSVPSRKVTPVGILPALHKIDSKFVETAVEVFVEQSESISCKAGCGACCRQMVPLAEFEAYQIAGIVEQLTEPKRTTIKQKFAEGCEKLENMNWLDDLKQLVENRASKPEFVAHSLAYFYQNIPCPFLEDESCSIHPHRPLACREYLVTSPAENCRNSTKENIRHIELKFQLSKIVRGLWKSGNLKELDCVPMIYALRWVATHPNKFSKKSGQDWLTELLNYFSSSK